MNRPKISIQGLSWFTVSHATLKLTLWLEVSCEEDLFLSIGIFLLMNEILQLFSLHFTTLDDPMQSWQLGFRIVSLKHSQSPYFHFLSCLIHSITPDKAQMRSNLMLVSMWIWMSLHDFDTRHLVQINPLLQML
jgi:hypothetical protein